MKNPFDFELGDLSQYKRYWKLVNDILKTGRSEDSDIPEMPRSPEWKTLKAFKAWLERQDIILLLHNDMVHDFIGMVCMEKTHVSLWVLDKEDQGKDLGKIMFYHLLNQIQYSLTLVDYITIEAKTGSGHILESLGWELDQQTGQKTALYTFPIHK